jgi:hypothetical protein
MCEQSPQMVSIVQDILVASMFDATTSAPKDVAHFVEEKVDVRTSTWGRRNGAVKTQSTETTERKIIGRKFQGRRA